MEDAELDARVKELLAAGDSRTAAGFVYERLSSEIHGFLVKHGLPDDQANDVLGVVATDLVTGIRTFRGESSVRSWVFGVVRNARSRTWTRMVQPNTERLATGQDVAAPPPDRGPRTTHQAWFARLRGELDPRDVELLELREERELSWAEIAALRPERTEAAWRKHYERLLAQLRERAERAGLR